VVANRECRWGALPGQAGGGTGPPGDESRYQAYDGEDLCAYGRLEGVVESRRGGRSEI